MSTTGATHLFTPDELQLLIEQALGNASRKGEPGELYAQIAQAKATAEIAYQLAKLNSLLENAVDQETGHFVVRPAAEF